MEWGEEWKGASEASVARVVSYVGRQYVAFAVASPPSVGSLVY